VASKVPVQSTQIQCPRCGTNIASGTRFCPICGLPFTNPPSVPAPIKKSTIGLPIILIVVGLAIVLIAAAIMYAESGASSTGSNDQSGNTSTEGFTKVNTGLEYKVTKVATITDASKAPLNHYGSPSITANDISRASNISEKLIVVTYQVHNPSTFTKYLTTYIMWLDIGTTTETLDMEYERGESWVDMGRPDSLAGGETFTFYGLYRIPVGDSVTGVYYLDDNEDSHGYGYPKVSLPLPQ